MNASAKSILIGICFALFCTAASAQLTFQRRSTPFGPISIDKFLSAGNTVFALRSNTNQTGYNVYRSTDNGVHWSTDSLLVVGDLVAWGNGNLLALNAHQVLRSSNYGASWSADSCDFPAQVHLNTLVRTQTGSMVASTREFDYNETTHDRLYLSTDNGTHWVSQDFVHYLRAVANCVARNGTIYSMTMDTTNEYWEQIINIYTSQTDGSAWSLDTAMQVSIWADDEPAGYPVGLVAGPDSSVYVVTTQEIYRKGVGDTNWNGIGNVNINMTGITAMAINQMGELLISEDSYYFGYRLFHSTNLGASWVESAGRPDTLLISQLYFGENGTGFCCGCDNYRTTDNGVSWSPILIDTTQRGLNSLFLTRSGTLIAQSPQVLFTNYRSVDQGIHWQTIADGIPTINDEIVDVFDHDDSILTACVCKYATFAQSASYSLYHSTNDGRNWNPVLFDSTYMNEISSIFPGTSGTIIGRTNSPRYFISRDNGITWHTHRLLNMLPMMTQFLTLSDNTYLAFTDSAAYYPNSRNHFYTAGDDSANWTALNTVLFSGVNKLYQTRSGNLLASKGSYFHRPTDYAIYRSTDLGGYWIQILPTPEQQSIFPQAENTNGDMFGFDSLGSVMRSVDEGLTWQQVTPDSLCTGNYTSLLRMDGQGYLYLVNTNNHLFYRTTTTTFDVKELHWASLPISPELKQNYPNPFNSTTRISFSLPHSSRVTLSIFDLLGRRVTTILNNQPLSAGSHQTEWNAESLSSGIYFYRLQAGNTSITRKLTLLK